MERYSLIKVSRKIENDSVINDSRIVSRSMVLINLDSNLIEANLRTCEFARA